MSPADPPPPEPGEMTGDEYDLWVIDQQSPDYEG